MIKNLKLSECLDLLGNNYIGRLAFVSHGNPYVVPITYFHDSEERCILSYAGKGHKIEAMRNYDSVALQVDEIKSIQEWKSALVHGKFEELDGTSAKSYLHRFAEGVKDIIGRKDGETPKSISDFSAKLSQRGVPIVYRINITDISGKYRKS